MIADPPPATAAGAYGLRAPTEADLVALLARTAGCDARGAVAQARRDAYVPAGPLSLDQLEAVARAVVTAGEFPTTVSARSFLIRLFSYRALAARSAPPQAATTRPAVR